MDQRPLEVDIAPRRQSAGQHGGDEPPTVDRVLLPPELRRRDPLHRELHRTGSPAPLPAYPRRRAHADEDGQAVTTIAEDLAAWVAGLSFADLPLSVVADAKLRVLDTLGISLAARWLPIGAAVRRGASAIGGGDEASILGTAERTSAALAGLVNG